MMVASTTFPLRNRNIHMPMKMAIGMVDAMVKSPQDDSLRAFTTTRPSPAMAMMMIRNVATEAVIPLERLPIS